MEQAVDSPDRQPGAAAVEGQSGPATGVEVAAVAAVGESVEAAAVVGGGD
jgi:hypothetical protein